MSNFNWSVDLKLFDGEGGTAESAASSASESMTGTNDPMGETRARRENTRRGKSGDSVIYGKQSAADESGNAAAKGNDTPAAEEKDKGEKIPPTREEKRNAFRGLIEGEYKDLYAEETQKLINQRFKETKNLEKQIGEASDVLDILFSRYNIKNGDMNALKTAINGDDGYFRDAAEREGLTVEQYRFNEQLKAQNANLLRAEAERKSREAAETRLAAWYQESEKVKGVYPEFNLNAEAKNPEFMRLLKAGTPMQHAYEVVHIDDIKSSVAESAASAREKEVVEGIRQKGARPDENGAASRSGFTIKDDVRKFTKEDRAEIARRVARGEIINL